MLYLKRTILLAVCMAFLSAVPLGQTSKECRALSDPFNENSDRFVGSWSGNVTGIQISEKKFGEGGKSVHTKITLVVGDYGRLIEWYLSNDRIPKFGRQVYAYDVNGRVIKRTSYNPDGSAVLEDIYTLDPKGNVLTKLTQNSKSKIVIGSTQEFKYESEDIYSEYSDGKFVRRIKLERDDKCRIRNQTWSDVKGKLEINISLKYDSHGNVVENIVYSPLGKPTQKLKWEYDYDDKSNWVRKRSFEWHFWDQSEEYTLVSEEIRTISYADSSKK